MARILMCMPPLTGHINPARVVAGTLERRGHTVSWAVPGDIIGICADNCGKRIHLPLDSSLFSVRPSHDIRGLESVHHFYEDFYLPLATATLEPLERAVRRQRPDVIFCDHQMLSGALVARKLNIPWLTSITTSASMFRMPPKLEHWIEEKLARAQQRCGLDPVVARPDLSPAGAVVFSAESLLGEQTLRERIPATYHFVGPAIARHVRVRNFPWHSLNNSRRKILISLGTVNRDRSLRFYQVMMEALAATDLQVVMAAPEELALGAPANFIVRDRLPLVEILPHVDAVVCHAGHNTVCEALWHGVPLAVAPIRDDQPVIARQVVDAGAGVYLRFGKITPATARQKLCQLLDNPAYTLAAGKIAEQFRALGGAERAAQLIDQLATGPAAHTDAAPGNYAFC